MRAGSNPKSLLRPAIFWWLSLLIVVPYFLRASGAALPVSGPIVPELQPLADAMTNFMSPRSFEAGTIALMKDDLLVLRQGFGWQNQSKTAVIHPDAIMRLASVCKPLTGSAITKLVKDGRLSYDTKVYSLLGLEPFGGVLGDSRITNITIRQLLDHTAGWDRGVGPVFDPVFSTLQISGEMGLDHPANPAEVIRWMFAKPLQFAPGTKSVYSNFGYDVLGRVIEKVTGVSYAAYLRNILFQPLGITNIIQSRSRPLDRDPREIWYADSSLERSAVDYPTNKLVSFADGGGYTESFDSFGGMAASAVDLCRYTQRFFVSDARRPTSGSWSWNYVFYGSLPGTTTAIHQDLSLTSSSTNALEFAVLFNKRTENSSIDENDLIHSMVVNAASSISSWPAAGGGKIQWAITATNVSKRAGSVTIALLRTVGSTRAVKASYSTHSAVGPSTNFTPQSGIIDFAAGEVRKDIAIPILDNGLLETPAPFTLELISASGGAWLGDSFTATINVFSPVRLQAVTSSTADPFILNIASGAGAVIQIEKSSDLVQWQKAGNVTNSSGSMTWTDPNAPPGYEYYRASIVP